MLDFSEVTLRLYIKAAALPVILAQWMPES
jgi:hypothetical protein